MEQHRGLSANLIKRSRYFIANASKMNSPSETKGQIEGGPRFVEGAAGGTIMIGEPPANDIFPVHFNWPDVVIPTPFDNPDIGKLIEDLDSDPDRLEQARKNNIVNCLQRHDWAYRWKAILDMVGMEPTDRLLKRERYLERLARLVRSGGNKTK